MNPRSRNALVALVLVLLVAGIVAALVHDHDSAKSTASGASQPQSTTTVATTPTTTGPTPSTSPTTRPGAAGGATSTTAAAPITRQPRTGGPATLPIGLGLVAAGLLMLRVHQAAARQAGVGPPGV